MDRSDLLDCPKCQRSTDKMVVMACDHHLCLQCAASIFVMRKSSDRTRFHIDCEFCHNTTMVQQSTVNCLVEYLQDITRAGISRRKPKPQPKPTTIPSTSPSVSSQSDRLLCLDCHHALSNIDEYLKGQHKQHNVQNLKNTELLIPLLTEIKAVMQDRIAWLTAKTKEEESLLGFLSEKKEVERGRVQMVFTKIRKLIDQRETTAYRFIQQMFAEQSQLLERSLAKSNEHIFQLDMKFNELADVMRDKTLNLTFNFVKNNKVEVMAMCRKGEGLDESRLKSLQRELEGNVAVFQNWVKEMDRYREEMPAIHQPVSKLDTPRLLKSRKKSCNIEQPSELKSISILKNNSPTPPQLKFARSSSSLGPSLLKVEQSTPIEGLIRALQKKIHRNTLKLSANLNLGSPRHPPLSSSSLRPVDRIRRLFSPS